MDSTGWDECIPTYPTIDLYNMPIALSIDTSRRREMSDSDSRLNYQSN